MGRDDEKVSERTRERDVWREDESKWRGPEKDKGGQLPHTVSLVVDAGHLNTKNVLPSLPLTPWNGREVLQLVSGIVRMDFGVGQGSSYQVHGLFLSAHPFATWMGVTRQQEWFVNVEQIQIALLCLLLWGLIFWSTFSGIYSSSISQPWPVPTSHVFLHILHHVKYFCVLSVNFQWLSPLRRKPETREEWRLWTNKIITPPWLRWSRKPQIFSISVQMIAVLRTGLTAVVLTCTEGNFSVIVWVIKIFGDDIIRSSTQCCSIYYPPTLLLSVQRTSALSVQETG